MKKLVLGSLFLALIASQATGCIISSDDAPEDAFVTAQWSFRNVASQANTGCPAGFATVALYNQEVDSNDRPIAGIPPEIDLFDCIDGSGTTGAIPAVAYETWYEVTNGDGGALYGQSLAAIVDVTIEDKTFSASILNDGGYFSLSWILRGDTSARTLNCSEIPNIDGVEIVTTLTSGGAAVVDKFDCGAAFEISGGLLQGSYTVSVDAFQDGAGGGALGEPVTLTNRTIADRNDVTDLGTITLPIDGL